MNGVKRRAFREACSAGHMPHANKYLRVDNIIAREMHVDPQAW